MKKKTILRWYHEVLLIMGKALKDIQIFPKIMNLDYVVDFQIQKVEAFITSGADVVVIGNRIYKKEYSCAHSGNQLRERNLQQIKIIKGKHKEIRISRTGGIYSGKHIKDYIRCGSENIQLLIYLMGKVKKKFVKKEKDFSRVSINLCLMQKTDTYLAC